MRFRRLAPLLLLLAAQAPALQAPPAPQLPVVQTPGLTPLGPVQTAPAQAPPPIFQGLPAPAPIQSQPMPNLTPAPEAPPASAPRPAPQTELPQVVEPSTAQPIAGDWQPRAGVVLQALDKVTARSTSLAGKVGETLHFGSLSIIARSCVARPPDQRQDFAAYLDITDANPGNTGFHGWMLTSEPALSMLEHPVYDIRLTACRP